MKKTPDKLAELSAAVESRDAEAVAGALAAIISLNGTGLKITVEDSATQASFGGES